MRTVKVGSMIAVLALQVVLGPPSAAAATQVPQYDSVTVAWSNTSPSRSILEAQAELEVSDVPLEVALEALRTNSRVPIAFSPTLLPRNRHVSCACRTATVRQALDHLLKGTNLQYEAVRAQILIEPIAPRPELPRLAGPIGSLASMRAIHREVGSSAGANQHGAGSSEDSAAAAAVQGSISGRVLDAATQQPLSGVNIILVGTQRGTLTNADGRFAISAVPSGPHRVRASLIGYAEQEQTVAVEDGQSATTNFQLQSRAVQLEGIVAVGYGTLRRRNVTGSISSVSAEQLQQQASVSVLQAMQGRAAGVQIVQNSGAPGVTPTVRIRGGNSFLGGNAPLYVIDGLPVPGNPLATISPDNVASIEILKDASATAIYGARGANGVVLITTKRGPVGLNRVTFESFTGVQQVSKRLDLLDAQEFAAIANERARNDGTALPFPDLSSLAADTDWQDEVFRAAPLQNYTLTFSGGTDQTRYLLSANYLDQQGIILNSGFERGALRFNFDQDVSSRFRISSSLNLARSVRNDGATTAGDQNSVVYDALGAPPVVPVYDADGKRNPVNTFPFSAETLENPVARALDPLNRTNRLRVVGHLSGDYELVDGLTARVLVGTDYEDRKQDVYFPRTVRAGSPNGSGATVRAEDVTFITENTLTLDRELGGEQRINALAGVSFQTNQFSQVRAASQGFVTDDLSNRNLGAGERFTAPQTSGHEWTLASYLGRVNYALRDRYMITVTGRYDGSSRFGANNKWGFFPSAAVAWLVSEESFVPRGGVVSDLKLRASWGRTGNQEIPLYRSLQQIVSEAIAFGNSPTVGFAPTTVPNPDLRWETTEQIDLGVDLGLWDQRVRVAGDVYRKETSDLLALVQLPTSSGYRESVQNIGAIRNTGVELSAGADLMRRSEFTWTLDANISTNRNVVTRTAGGVDVLAPNVSFLIPSSTIVREGEPLGAFYGFIESGLDAEGRITYVDQNGDGVINDADRVVLGSPYPDYTYGLNTTLRYRRLEMNAFVQGAQGAQVLNANRYYFANSFNRGLNQVREVLDYWTPENPNARYPKISANSSFRVSDRFIEDASYLRLKNVRVAYELPESWVRVGRATDATVYLSAQNLFTRTNYSWFDPEVSVFSHDDNLRFGIDNSGFPHARTFTFGMRFGL
jgi:TonB-dependent starch-binding outer membrane protein SusC